MAWTPPRPPLTDRASRISYWRAIIDIPDAEPAAPLLRSMAAHRLLELGGVTEAENNRLRSLLQETTH